jgi:peroxiredoxin
VRELPSTIEPMQREFGDRGLTVLAIDIQEDPVKVAAWAKQRNLTTAVLLDRDGSVSSSYRVTGTPTAFLLGRDGKLVAKAVGTKPWRSSEGRALLEALLK